MSYDPDEILDVEDEQWPPAPTNIGLRYEPEIDSIVQFDEDTGHEMRVEPCNGLPPNRVVEDEQLVGRLTGDRLL